MSHGDTPTLTIMRHADVVVKRKGPTQTSSDFFRNNRRLHDPSIVNDDDVLEAASLLLLDLGISEKNCRKHRVLVVSSPFLKCLESAVLVCQIFGVESFYVHYGLGDSMNNILASGWDWATVPLQLPRHEMERHVNIKSRQGERKGRNRIKINNYLGTEKTVQDKSETLREFHARMNDTLDEIRLSLERPGDRMIVIGHDETLINGAKKFDDMEVFEPQPNRYCYHYH